MSCRPTASAPTRWWSRAAPLAAPVLAMAVSGCASTITDHLPVAAGGLPENAPARPAVEGEFPAVHAMPPPRETSTLSSEQQRKLQQDLIAARNRVSGEAAGSGTPQPAAASDKNP